MRIEHLAIYTHQLEILRDFYVTYFGARSNDGYSNPTKNFRSYFLEFGDGARLELMQQAGIPENLNDQRAQFTGLIHFAIATESKEAVDQLTERLRLDGFPVLDGPRTTGDGYYESVVQDPDGNRIEITC
jgi:lactoylglutathione lyase